MGVGETFTDRKRWIFTGLQNFPSQVFDEVSQTKTQVEKIGVSTYM